MKIKKIAGNIRLFLFILLISGCLLITLTNLAAVLGTNIPQKNIEEDYVFGFLWAILLGGLILVLPLPKQDKPVIFDIWLFKSIITLVFMLFYEKNYGLDSYYYFSFPQASNFEWTGFKIGGSGTEHMMNLVWLYFQIMPTSFHGLKVTFSLIGLVAIYIFYRSAVMYLNQRDTKILYLLGFFPSIAFWSSIIGKDPIMLLGIAIYVYGIVGWYKFKKYGYIVWMIIGLILAALVRIWMPLILVLPLVTVSILGRSKGGFLKKTIISAFLIAITLAAFTQLQSSLKVELQDPQNTAEYFNKTSQNFSGGGSAQKVTSDFTQSNQTIAFLPLGIFTALFRPLPGEVMNPFGIIAGLENLILLVLLWRALHKIVFKKQRQDLKDSTIQWAIVFVIFWAAIYGFISFGNLGTAVRYRLQVLPVLLGLLIYLGRKKNARKSQIFLINAGDRVSQ